MSVLRLILLSFCFMLMACGKPQSSHRPIRLKETITQDQLQTVVNNQSLHCTETAGCPEGMARMFTINIHDMANSSVCSAFLVAPDIMMTNSHCVYAGQINLQDTCEGIYFAFPNKDGAATIAHCTKIIWRQNLRGRDMYRKGDNDFALIKIDRALSITPLSIKRSGMRKGDKVFPVVIDHNNIFQANIVKLHCEVEKVSAKWGVATLKNCPIISGNSGGAVLDESGHVVGIIFASSDEHIKNPGDTLAHRRASTSKGYAFSMDHIDQYLGRFL